MESGKYSFFIHFAGFNVESQIKTLMLIYNVCNSLIKTADHV